MNGHMFKGCAVCFPVCDSVFLVLPWDKKKWSRWTKLVACKSDIPLSKADGNHGGIVMQGAKYDGSLHHPCSVFCVEPTIEN